MGSISSHFFPNKPDTPRGAVHMNVNRKYRLSAAKQQNASRRFRPDSLKAVQPCGALFYGQTTQKVEIELAAFFGNLAHNRLEARRFGLRPVHIFNGLLYFIRRRIAHSLPGAKAI